MTDITPRRGVPFWSNLPPIVECKKCWPRPGYGHKGNREAIQKVRRLGKPESTVDIEGPCDECQGTGIAPLPRSELVIFNHAAWWFTDPKLNDV